MSSVSLGHGTNNQLALLALCLTVSLEAEELVGPPAPQRRSPPQDAVHQTRTDLAWIVGAAVLDLGTTELALSRCPSCVEGNPLAGDRSARLALKLGYSAATGVLCYKLHKAGRHRDAKYARWATVGIWVAASVVNMTHLR